MKQNNAKSTFTDLMEMAGIKVNGNAPFDIQVHDRDFYARVLQQPFLGLGESYMDGWWDCDAIDRFIEKIMLADVVGKLKQDWTTVFNIVKARIINLQSQKRSHIVGEQHYDVGNDLYTRMLDKRMQYTCGYWKNADTLEKAQQNKLDLICKKIGLQPGMTVLELGCGFGGFARFAAKHYGAKVKGYTISREQAQFAEQYCKGLPVEIRLQDYRNATGRYDRVISIGLMEHVGYKNYRVYMKFASRMLKDTGIAFIHTIGSNISTRTCNAWTAKYIFPNSMLPSLAQLGRAMEGIFVLEDLHNIGEDYDKTLMAWHNHFEAAWPELQKAYSERFYRMWKFYLLSCAGGFRSRRMQLWQMVLTKPGTPQPDCRIS